MAEVFISYARGDQGFVRDLHIALQKVNRDIWVDWHDIPRLADWEKEIFGAINAAHDFVFVVSPDSCKSEMCLKEVAHAAANSKRLIPVVYRDVLQSEWPPSLSRVQWVSFTGEPFDLAFQKLIEALDTDLEWKRAHSRLLVKAAEWESSGSNDSFLLRKIDLQDAIGWLAQASSIQKERPTALEERYIRASQEWEAGELKRA